MTIITPPAVPASAAPPSLYDLAEPYDAILPPGPCETFYREEARRTGGPVLELACGTGRLTIPLAQDGHEVVGLDASPAMLARAKRKATEAGVTATFVSGDMRAFDLGQRFGFVLVSCNSLGHMTEPEDLHACLAAVRQHLAPGGMLAFDVVLPDPRHLVPPKAARAGLTSAPIRHRSSKERNGWTMTPCGSSASRTGVSGHLAGRRWPWLR